MLASLVALAARLLSVATAASASPRPSCVDHVGGTFRPRKLRKRVTRCSAFVELASRRVGVTSTAARRCRLAAAGCGLRLRRFDAHAPTHEQQQRAQRVLRSLPAHGRFMRVLDRMLRYCGRNQIVLDLHRCR